MRRSDKFSLSWILNYSRLSCSKVVSLNYGIRLPVCLLGAQILSEITRRGVRRCTCTFLHVFAICGRKLSLSAGRKVKASICGFRRARPRYLSTLKPVLWLADILKRIVKIDCLITNFHKYILKTGSILTICTAWHWKCETWEPGATFIVDYELASKCRLAMGTADVPAIFNCGCRCGREGASRVWLSGQTQIRSNQICEFRV